MGEQRQTGQSGWMRSLAHIEIAIGECLGALDRYEQKFGHVYTQVTGTPLPAVLNSEDPRWQIAEDVWQAKLAQAQTAADEVEGMLLEQQHLWEHWQESFRNWRDSLEKVPGRPPEPRDEPVRRHSARRGEVVTVR